jgi:hypothetical protein
MAISRAQQARQQYGLGSLVKSITKPIKKLVKSDAGKVGLLALGAFGLPGGFGGMTGFLSPATKGAIGSFFTENALGKIIRDVGVGTGIGFGLDAIQRANLPDPIKRIQGRTEDEINEIEAELRQNYADLGYDQEEIEERVRLDMEPYRATAATGGRIGFAGGSYKDKIQDIADELAGEIYDKDYSDLTSSQQMSVYKRAIRELDDMFADKADMMRKNEADGGRIGLARGTDEKVELAAGIESLPININSKGVKELDLRETGGFIPPVGVKEKADDIPAMLSNNEFVFTADAVRAAGGGSVDKGAQIMYDTMKKLESKIA